MVKVSVIVPVYNPGSYIDELVDSLLGQTMPAGEAELIFVDDGSTDGSGARLDALAAAHPHVKVEHIPNSGWPGRPRNVGLDMAAGEFVFFADNDDWLGPEALERLYARALMDGADIVMGKVVGHGKAVTRGLFSENRHDLTARDAPFSLLTPHKLFRRGLLSEHGIRFPEGRRRLEDHAFVVPAFFAARRIAILADYPCYHWVRREDGENASSRRPDWEGYFTNVREVLDVVDANAEPGEYRDRLYHRWYRGKLLSWLATGGFLQREPEDRRALCEAARALTAERFGLHLDAQLPFALASARRAGRGSLEGLEALGRYTGAMRSTTRVRQVRGDGTWLTLNLTARMWSTGDEGPMHVTRHGRPAGCSTRRPSEGVRRGRRARHDRSLLRWRGPGLPQGGRGRHRMGRPDREPRAADGGRGRGRPAPAGQDARARRAHDRRRRRAAAAGRVRGPGGRLGRRLLHVSRARHEDEIFTVTVTPAGRLEHWRPPAPPPPPPPPAPVRVRRAAAHAARQVPGVTPAFRRARRVRRAVGAR